MDLSRPWGLSELLVKILLVPMGQSPRYLTPRHVDPIGVIEGGHGVVIVVVPRRPGKRPAVGGSRTTRRSSEIID